MHILICFMRNQKYLLLSAIFVRNRCCSDLLNSGSIIPDSVFDEGCFWRCGRLLSVAFGTSSSLERICAETFQRRSIDSLYLPASAVELAEGCED